MTDRPNLLVGEALPRAPRQQRSLAKRARLEAAALALFGERGYDGTSIEAIAKRAKLAVGTFYQHFRSKRQLLLVLMDELLDTLNSLHLRPTTEGDVHAGLRGLLARAFSADLRYLGAYRAWREATITDPDLARKQDDIHAWTTTRVVALFQFLQHLPGARRDVDLRGVARVMDSFFWGLLAHAPHMPGVELSRWIDASVHLIYHALFIDPPLQA